MLNTMASPVVAVALVLAFVMGPAILTVWLVQREKRRARQQRRSPLTGSLLRTAGHTLSEQLEEERLDAITDAMAMMVLPGAMLAALFAIAVWSARMPPLGVLVVLAVATALLLLKQGRSLLRRSERMDQLRLGLDAERAAGQELDQLMRMGASVFHDLPAEKFNIDHVVVAPQGVFAVETKGYRKPNRPGSPEVATVVYDGQGLRFPEWGSDKPLKQAERQARWLADWLTGATGERIQVTPVLALPGWFVETKGRGSVRVISGAQLQKHLLRSSATGPLSAEQQQRVAHQVEQRCRDVKPSYRPASDGE